MINQTSEVSKTSEVLECHFGYRKNQEKSL